MSQIWIHCSKRPIFDVRALWGLAYSRYSQVFKMKGKKAQSNSALSEDFRANWAIHATFLSGLHCLLGKFFNCNGDSEDANIYFLVEILD